MLRLTRSSFVTVALFLIVFVPGCFDAPQGQGPGHREQPLALTANQELRIGREAYQQLLQSGTVLAEGPERDQLYRVTQRIAKAVQIEPLQREINLHIAAYPFEWEYNVLQDDRANAFCLPGGKIGVLSGLFQLIRSDDQLATVIAHEVAHALAHHASERVARERALGRGLLALAYNREQESEADHIGIFLMTFAGYEPEEALVFWKAMQAAGRHRSQLPEVLSDHPNDVRRMERMKAWIPQAKAAKRAYEEGRIAPASTRSRQ